MTLAINIVDWLGLIRSNEVCLELCITKEEQGNAVLAVHFTVKGV